MPLRIGRRKCRFADTPQPMQRRNGNPPITAGKCPFDRSQRILAAKKNALERRW
jgi:hypothetical protein